MVARRKPVGYSVGASLGVTSLGSVSPSSFVLEDCDEVGGKDDFSDCISVEVWKAWEAIVVLESTPMLDSAKARRMKVFVPSASRHSQET